MDQSHIPKKRVCYRCCDCNGTFEDYGSFRSHEKTDCVKSARPQPSSAVTGEMTRNLSGDSKQKSLEILTNQLKSETARSHVETLKSAMASKTAAFEAFIMAGTELQEATKIYNATVQEKVKARKAYEEALYREKSLSTITSVQEQLIVSDIRARALAGFQIALTDEQYATSAVGQVLNKQTVANQAAVKATTLEHAAFCNAVEAIREEVNGNESSSNIHKVLSDIQKVLSESNAILATLQEEALRNSTSIRSAVETSNGEQVPSSENSAASTSGTQLREMMETSTAASDDTVRTSTPDFARKTY